MQLLFTLEDDCFAHGDGPEPVPLTIGAFDARLVDPFEAEIPQRFLFHNMDVAGMAAYQLAVADRTLCAFLSWDPDTTAATVDLGRAVIESIRAEPIGSTGIRVVFTTEEGWDTG